MEIIFTSAVWEDHADFLTSLFSNIKKTVGCQLREDYGGDVKRFTAVLISISYDDKQNFLFAEKQTMSGVYLDINNNSKQRFISIGVNIPLNVLEERDELKVTDIFLEGIISKVIDLRYKFPVKFDRDIFSNDLNYARSALS